MSEQVSGASANAETGSCPAGQAPSGLVASRCDPARWRPLDILSAAGDIWRVVEPPEDRPDWIMVERLFSRDDSIMDVPCGHAYPADHRIWDSFERLQTGSERYSQEQSQ